MESIMRSKTNERTKFMEGASWVAKKSQLEADRISKKMRDLA